MKRRILRTSLATLLIFMMILQTTSMIPIVSASSPDAYAIFKLSFEDNLIDSTGKHTGVNYERLSGGSVSTQTPTYTDGVRTGRKAIDFPNAGNYYYLNLGTAADLCPSSFSVSLWINQDNAWGSAEQILVWNKNEYFSNGWYISSNGSNVPLAISFGPATSGGQPYQVQVQGARTDFFPLNTWVHVGITYDGLKKECKVFRNGILQPTTVTQALSATSTGVVSDSGVHKSIGFNGPFYANGGQATFKLDEFTIYDQVLTQAEVISVIDSDLGGTFDLSTILQADYNALTLTSRTHKDISLPSQGNNGSAITWKSSDTSVVRNDGTVVDPNLSEEKTVTLTATLSYGDLTLSKPFSVVIVPASLAFPDPETDPSLRVWYKMNETGGTTVTNAGRGGPALNGTASNSAGFTTGSGGFDTASNRYITLPRTTTLADVTGDFTITTKVNFRSGGTWSRLFDFGANTSSNIIFMCADTLQVNMDNANAIVPPANNNNANNSNRWRAVTVSRKGNITSIYVNGTLVASGNQTSNVANRTASSGNLYIARSNWGADPYPNMVLKDFRIYARALEADELQAIYAEYRDPSAMITDDHSALSIKERTSTDLTLPSTGAAGSKIQWESSDESVMLSSGKIADPTLSTEKTVVLKATLTYSTLTMTKYFLVTVVPDIGYKLNDSGMDNVTLYDSWLVNAMQKDIDYSLYLDAEKLLFFYEYYCCNGVTTASAPYDGWERGPASFSGGSAQNFRGFTLGRLLGALSQQYVNTRDDPETHAKILNQIKTCISGLKRCQDTYAAANPTKAGFLASFPETRLNSLRDSGSNSDPLVPFWILDSMLTGIVDVANYVKDDPIGNTAAEIAAKFGEYLYSYTATWTTAQRNRVLGVEYGGMNIALYMLYDLTGNINDRKTAEIFEETTFLDQLANEQDVLSGKHANTQIPKFVGAMKRYSVITRNPDYYNALTDAEKEQLETRYLAAAKGFWNVVTRNHSYVTGGNSQGEHFRAPNSQATYYNSSDTCETCNTYNMLRLTRELFKVTKEKRYLDFYENTFTNAILSSQNPETGMFMYFQPMSYGWRKVFSTETGRFWCCVGTGMDSFSKLNDSIYFTDEDSVYVNMYYSSEFRYAAKNLKLSQTANMPNSDVVTFAVNAMDGGDVAADTDIYFRLPDWCDGNPAVKLNGKTVVPAIADGFILISGVQKGDTIELSFPMKVVLYSFPTNRNIAAFKYGPVVLSAGYGTANMTATANNGILVLVSTQVTTAGTSITVNNGTISDWKANIANNLVRIEDSTDGQVQFRLNGTDKDSSFIYTPHYRRYAERYGIYIPLAGTTGEYAGIAQSISVSQQDVTVYPGQKKNMTATVTFSDGTTRDVTSLATYKSFNSDVCTASSGVIEGVEGGHAYVLVSYSGLNGGTVSIPIMVSVPEVTFTGAGGEKLTGLTSTELNVTLPYYNKADTAADLIVIAAIYESNGALLRVATAAETVNSLATNDFKAKIILPDNADGSYADKGCYATVFLWDSHSLIPVMKAVTAFK